MTDFTGKIIAITGAASGIGLATAHLLASHGASLSLADLNAPALDSLAAAISAEHPSTPVLTHPVDVRDLAHVTAWISATKERFGALDGCANLAGVFQPRIVHIDSLPAEDWDSVLAVNLTGLFLCLQAQIPAMRAGGAIVNAASVAGLRGEAGMAAYVASKHGVVGMSKSAAKELGPKGIRCNVICPGPIDTPMLQDAIEKLPGGKYPVDHLALRRKGEPEEVATLIEFLLSDNSSYITGASYTVDGGMQC